jgi:hypothetical protein
MTLAALMASASRGPGRDGISAGDKPLRPEVRRDRHRSQDESLIVIERLPDALSSAAMRRAQSTDSS